MGNVVMQASMSLDGFIADPSDGVGSLFEWYGNGEVAFTGNDPDRVFRVTQNSADYLATAWANVGAGVIGRRLFDLTNGWNGVPPVEGGVFVVTHTPPSDWAYPDAPFEFVTAGVAQAIARAKMLAGERDVSVSPGDVGRQALELGLVDELRVDLIPVVFGNGVRYFGGYAGEQIRLQNPQVVQGDRVTHLHYRLGGPR